MNKGIVALLIVLALIVLVSPGIVGRLAEQSMDENLDWATTESQQVVVTAEGFDRGWFSSEGQHRIEVRNGALRDALLLMADADATSDLPVLIINTRLDHGLIPVTSLSRERGSLKPGLGSAISTLSLELGDGDAFKLPGTIYSNVGLTGELQSNFQLEPGSLDHEVATASWGSADVRLTTNPSTGAVSLQGDLALLAIESIAENVRIEQIKVSSEQIPSPFGFAVGTANISVQSISFDSDNDHYVVGPLSIETNASIDDGRANGHAVVKLDNMPFADLGSAGVVADIRVENADGASLGNIKRGLEAMQMDEIPADAFMTYQGDVQRLLASGLELHIDQFDIALPQGQVNSKFSFVVAETDLDEDNWTSVLLALDASADISLPSALVDLAIATNPQINAAIGMGFLRKNGDVYEMEAAYKKGLLTVNGAPMPIPLPGVQ